MANLNCQQHIEMRSEQARGLQFPAVMLQDLLQRPMHWLQEESFQRIILYLHSQCQVTAEVVKN